MAPWILTHLALLRRCIELSDEAAATSTCFGVQLKINTMPYKCSLRAQDHIEMLPALPQTVGRRLAKLATGLSIAKRGDKAQGPAGANLHTTGGVRAE